VGAGGLESFTVKCYSYGSLSFPQSFKANAANGGFLPREIRLISWKIVLN
jgi:hypothetical protein